MADRLILGASKTMYRYAALILSLLLITACTTPAQRTISGTLVQSGNRRPVSSQLLALDRPPGDYQGVVIPLSNPPGPVTIATATTDARGRFSFTTTQDLQRDLTIRLIGTQPMDYYGYSIAALKDSQSAPPQVGFDTHLIHSPSK